MAVVTEKRLLLLPQDEGFPRIVSGAAFLSLRDEVAELQTLLSLPEMREALASSQEGTRMNWLGQILKRFRTLNNSLQSQLQFVRDLLLKKESIFIRHTLTHSKATLASPISRGSNPNYSPNFYLSNSCCSHSDRSKGRGCSPHAHKHRHHREHATSCLHRSHNHTYSSSSSASRERSRKKRTSL